MVKVLVLKKRKEFVRAAKGLKMVFPSFILQAAQSLSAPYKPAGDNCFLGYTATKKIGKAFLRNRTKRRLRAAAAEVFPIYAKPFFDYVLIGRYSTAKADFCKMKNDMRIALQKIHKEFEKQNEDARDENVADLAD